MVKKCEVCGKWLKNNRGYKIHYRMMHTKKVVKKVDKNDDLKEILNRIRKLELDNNFLKHQLKNKVYVDKSIVKSKDSKMDWKIQKNENINMKAVKSAKWGECINEMRTNTLFVRMQEACA